jgi:alpha-ketoglutarate-dependent taurine dioxygenase
MVRHHPDTGRPFLFLTRTRWPSLRGMEDTEARALLAKLARFATQDRFVYTYVWQKVGQSLHDAHGNAVRQ